MFDEDFIPIFAIPLVILFTFGFLFMLFSTPQSSNNTYIPPCDFEHRGHWEVSVHNANDQSEVEPVVNKYLALHWHNITAEIHNEGVQDRILANCG